MKASEANKITKESINNPKVKITDIIGEWIVAMHEKYINSNFNKNKILKKIRKRAEDGFFNVTMDVSCFNVGWLEEMGYKVEYQSCWGGYVISWQRVE